MGDKSSRRNLPPGARWTTLPSGQRRVELVIDVGSDPATGKRQQARRRFKTAEEAVREYAKIKAQTHEGTYVGRSTVTVERVCADWLAGRRLRSNTLANYSNSLKPVTRTYGALPVQKLTKGHINDLVTRLQAGQVPRADGRRSRPWQPKTINLMLTVLSGVLDDAQRQGLVVRNVARLVDRIPQGDNEMDTYTPAEVRKVLSKARSDRLEHVWHLALSGLRRGEVCGLAWSDVDFTSRTLTVRENRVSVDGQVVSQEPKSERGKRTLPLTDDLVVVLRRARRPND